MPQRAPRCIGLLSALVFVVVPGLALSSTASPGEPIGTVDDNGNFLPKVTVMRLGADILVKKLDPDERFDSLRIRFLSPNAEHPEAFERVYIRWEKGPEKWGKDWVLRGHRGFNEGEAVFTAAWGESLAFRLTDRSETQFFANRPWDKVISIWLDGDPVGAAKPPAARQAPPPERPRVTEVAPRPAPVPQQTAAAVRPRGPAADSIDASSHAALEVQYLDLLERIKKIEQELASTRRRFFWGPVIALSLAILFSSVAILVTYIRLSQGGRSGGLPSFQPLRLKIPSADGFRRNGRA
jgi:hypothetical protein